MQKHILTVTFLILLFGCSEPIEKKEITISKNEVDRKAHVVQNSNAIEWNSNWKSNNTVVFHIVGEPASLHPTNEPSTIAQLIFGLTHGFIIRGDMENLKLQPGVITALPLATVDGLSYDYQLRKDVTWDDGSQISLEDIEFTLKVIKCPLVENGASKSYFENLMGIHLSSETNSFTLRMKEEYIQNVAFLGDYPILQRSFYDPNGVLGPFTIEDFDNPDFEPTEEISTWAGEFNSSKYGRDIESLNGAGAYRVNTWESGSFIRLTKKEDHWTSRLSNPSIYETAYPDTIIFQLNNDASSQYLEFKNQNFDGSGYLSAQTMTKLMNDAQFNENYHSAYLPTFNFSYAAMNLRPSGTNRTPYFTNKNVRRAMALLTPVQDMIDLLFEGQSTRRVGAVSDLKETFNKDLKPIEVDIENAKQLLEESGWKDSDGDGIREKLIDGKSTPLEFELLYMSNMSVWGDMAQLMAETMKKAGVNPKLTPIDFSILYQRAASHDFDMLLCAWGGTSQPDDHTQIWHTSSWLNNGSNFTGFGTTESDSLIDLSKTTLDEEKRKEIEFWFQEIVHDEQPYIFLMNGTRKVVLHKRFDNANMYSEKPGVVLNNLMLSNTVKQTVSVQP